jgi:hypothetical protein
MFGFTYEFLKIEYNAILTTPTDLSDVDTSVSLCHQLNL